MQPLQEKIETVKNNVNSYNDRIGLLGPLGGIDYSPILGQSISIASQLVKGAPTFGIVSEMKVLSSAIDALKTTVSDTRITSAFENVKPIPSILDNLPKPVVNDIVEGLKAKTVNTDAFKQQSSEIVRGLANPAINPISSPFGTQDNKSKTPKQKPTKEDKEAPDNNSEQKNKGKVD